jgi:hypothetical protein
MVDDIMKITYKPSFGRILVIIFLVLAFISMVYSLAVDTYLHYKIHSGDLELYNIESKVIDGEISANVFERIGRIDGYVLLYDTRTNLVYIGDEKGNLTPYYANSSGKLVMYDKSSNRLLY